MNKDDEKERPGNEVRFSDWLSYRLFKDSDNRVVLKDINGEKPDIIPVLVSEIKGNAIYFVFANGKHEILMQKDEPKDSVFLFGHVITEASGNISEYIKR